MMSWVLRSVGAILALTGALWILQGTNVVPVGFMAGHIQYAIAGLVAIVIGAGLFWLSLPSGLNPLHRLIRNQGASGALFAVLITSALDHQPKIRFVEKGEREGEDVYLALGRSGAGRYLAVLFEYKKSREALILSARDMAQKERNQYGKK
jgi:uncharacterized protein